jgi:hypothetical protein
MRVSALAELSKQLRFVPAETARRHLERAESLVREIDPQRWYPEDWLTQRLTGYRPELDSPAMIAGEALLGDLPAVIERLSLAAALRPVDLAGWTSTRELCERWGVSTRTLERYRRWGLNGRRARRDDGKALTLYDPATIAWFEARHAQTLAEAQSHRRLDERTVLSMARRAGRYQRRLGWGRAKIARRLAERFGCSAETARRVLAQRNALGQAGPGPLRRAQAQSLSHALRRGTSVKDLAKATGKSPASVRRAAAESDAAALRGLDLHTPEGAGNDVGVLDDPRVRLGLGAPGAGTLAAMIEQAQSLGWPDAGDERTRAEAYWCLRRRAAALIASLPARNPHAGPLDEARTLLRWAARLKAELVRSQHLAMFMAIRTRLERGVETLPAAAAAGLLGACLKALAGAVDRFDPSKGGRLAAPAGLAINRALAQWAGEHPPAPEPRESRASSVSDPGAVRLEDWTLRVAPWQELVEPDPRVRRGLGALGELERRWLELRLGWLAGPPRTIAQTAAELGLTTARGARVERAALEEAIRAGEGDGAAAPAGGSAAGRGATR